MRYSLRNKDKIVESFGTKYYNLLVRSLDRYFKDRIEIEEHNVPSLSNKYKFIFVPNVQPKTDSDFVFAIIKKTYDVYLVAYYSAQG